MKINRALNLVIPIEGGGYVHSTPISREVFEKYFLVISKTFANIFSQGLGALAGPRVAFLMLKKTAEEMGNWPEVVGGLINEITRLSNLAYPTEKGWKTLPLTSAVAKGVINEDDFHEIEGELVFFTCVSMMNKRNQVEPIMETVNGLWGSQTTSFAFTEFTNSLKTSTEAVNSGETETTSSVPA
jgi:hypothetical protein